MAREARRPSPAAFQPPTVRTLDDVKRLIAELAPAAQTPAAPVDVRTQLREAGGGVGEAPKTWSVHVTTRSRGKREMLLEGLELVRRRQAAVPPAEAPTVNGRVMRPIDPLISVAARNWVDPLIKRWLGAVRDGLLIRWDLPDGAYLYDLFEHRLRRVVDG